MQTYVALSLLAMIFFGVNAIVYKIAPGIDAVTLTLVSFSTSAVATLLYWLFFVSLKQTSVGGIAWGIVAGVISVIALITYIRALQLGSASVVNAIRALSVGVTLILAILLLGEKITLIKGAGIILAILAATLLSI